MTDRDGPKVMYLWCAALSIIALMIAFNKAILIMLLLGCLALAAMAICGCIPSALRARLDGLLSQWIGRSATRMRVFSAIKVGWQSVKPFIFAGLLFAAAPISVLCMAIHWLRGFSKREKEEEPARREGLVFRQNIEKRRDEECAFFHSRAFAPTIIMTVGLGMPVAIMIFLYSTLGIEKITGETTSTAFPVQVATLAPTEPNQPLRVGRRPSLLQPYLASTERPASASPDDFQHFVIYAYIVSLAWCLSVLFLRAYFTFPLNFCSTEYDIEIDSTEIKKHPVKGWFAELIWYFWPEFTARSYRWSEIKRVGYSRGGVGRLSPLPASLFARESLVYKCLNRIAISTDALIDKLGRTEYLTLDINEYGHDSANNISVRLWELDSQARARLFYAIKSHAPHVYLDEIVQEKLLGSKVMHEARYTELWFDLLTSGQERCRQGLLGQGDTLCGGRYTVAGKLGTGGQASAYLARTETGEAVVLKEFILSSGDTFGALVESAADFENESSTLSRLHHEKVVKFLDIFAEDKRAYIVLEYVPGETLRQLVQRRGPVREAEAVNLAIEMCDILQYLHEQAPPVVHRDFTPENLIRQEDGSLKIVDFSVSSGSRAQGARDCVGKHSYTPPEQFRSQASPQSDLYALGATLFFLLTGLDPRPISASDPREKNPSISEELAVIVRKATAIDLNERYESAAWLRLDLEEWKRKSGETSEASTDDTGLKLKIPRKRKRVKAKSSSKGLKRKAYQA